MREVHATESQIAGRPHAQILFANGAKRPFRDREGGTDFNKMNWPVWVCFQKLFKPRDDRIGAPATGACRCINPFGEASGHDVHGFTFDGANHLRQLQDIGSFPDQPYDHPVQIQKP